ncbi:MAG: patatin-like phospholipase family protein [Rikenellaceae bacterium]|nr:patatin-like phospholipase family protein [Rikenellaceae bacterium]
MKKRVSLALSSGGPRGFAYIGAIEELTSRDYQIGSVAGTSIGSLVGGIYAAGKLEEFKEWLFALDAWKVFTLMDLSIGKNHLVKGERIIEAMMEIVPDVDIESLPIPFRAVATDLYTGEEVVFDRGKLFEAIRASISIPSLFRPVKHGLTTLVDGCIANCLPLDRVVRSEDDILVAFDVNDVDVAEIRSILARENAALVADTAFEQAKRAEMRGVFESVANRHDMGLIERLKYAGSRSIALIKDMINYEEEYDEKTALDYGDTYYDLLDRSFSLMNHRQSELSIALHRPDIVVKMPFDAYGEIADYAKAQEISEIGRQLMREALDEYEGK